MVKWVTTLVVCIVLLLGASVFHHPYMHPNSIALSNTVKPNIDSIYCG